MTRSAYVALANALAAMHPEKVRQFTPPLTNAVTEWQWQNSVRAIADVLEADTPGFARDRFIAACEGK